MRRDGRVDANQAEIVKKLREMGASVLILSPMGKGIPDLLIGWQGKNYLAEVKNLEGRGIKLTPDEQLFFTHWRGQAEIVTCCEDVPSLLEGKEP